MTNGHTHHQTDVVIVGAGPVGLFAIFECGMVRLKCHVVDVLDDVGGQCTALYPEKPIYDIPGFPRVAAAELIVRLRAQAAPFKPVYHLGEQVEALEPETGGFWRLTTSKGTVIQAKAVIVAAGVGAFGPNRPPLAGIEAYEGKSVFYYVTHRENFRGKRVVIAGGGDTAVDWALVARRDRGRRLGHPPARQVPRRARERGPAEGAGAGGQDRPCRALPAAGAGRRRRPAFVGDRLEPRRCREEDRGRRAAAVLRPVDVAGADRRLEPGSSSATSSWSIRRPRRPASPASSPSATWSPIRAS